MNYNKIKFGNPAKTYVLVNHKGDLFEKTALLQTTSKENKSYLAIAYDKDILIMTFGYDDEKE